MSNEAIVSEEILLVNTRIEQIKESAARFFSTKPTKSNIKKVRFFVRLLESDLNDMLKLQPKLTDDMVLKYLKSRKKISACGTLVFMQKQDDIQEHFIEYEQAIQPILKRLVEKKKIFKRLFCGGEKVYSMRNIYVFKESDLRNSYKIEGITYNKTK